MNIVGDVMRFGKASLVIEETGLAVARAAETIKACLQRRVLHFLESHVGPVLISHQGDCTPASVRYVTAAQVGDRMGREERQILCRVRDAEVVDLWLLW